MGPDAALRAPVIACADPIWDFVDRERIVPFTEEDEKLPFKKVARGRLIASLYFYTGKAQARPQSETVNIRDLLQVQ